jgi:tetratricopeptide (TPR) repeat protein
LYYKEEDFEHALEDFTEAIELGQAGADERINRGLALHRLGRDQEALAEIDLAIEMSASCTRVYFIRARVRDALKDFAGAKADREEGLKREPSDELSWVSRGVARLDSDLYGALADFREAIKINSRSLSGLFNAAYVLDRIGQSREALALLDTAAEAHPDNVKVRGQRGILLARQGKRAEAIAEAEAVLAATKDPASLFQAATIYARASRGNDDDARALGLLKLALQKGYGHALVTHHPDLAGLRGNADFQKLAECARGMM